MEIKKIENETDEELIYRVCSQKDIIGSWNDVADILNNLLNQEYTESKYRKQYQSFQKMLNANKEKFITDNNYSQEIERQYQELKKERIKLQTCNVERNRIDRAESRQELYYEHIGKIVNALEVPKFNKVEIKEEDKEYLCCLADVHYGAKFVSENNEYSPLIAQQRMELLLGYLMQFVKNHNIKKLNIVSLGDMIQGIIRMTDLQINDTTVMKSVVGISHLIANLLNDLSVECYVEYYHVPKANHTQIRVLGAKANELGNEDLEYVIGHYIKDLCANNERINVHLEEIKDYIEIPIFDYEIVALHGHTVKSIDNSIKDLSILTRKFLDYVILGHYHNGKEIPSYEGIFNDCEVLISPSFVGSDPYSDSIMRGSKSSVKIYGFNRSYGHTETYKFILN